MADDQAEMAKMKAHSTVGQAIGIGRKYVPLLDYSLWVLTAGLS